MRYFLEVSYKGTKYAGFQVQQNAITIQSELEKALSIYYKVPFGLTGSSRTDAGVHAHQNYLHVDTDIEIEPSHVYNINSILPRDIVLKAAHLVGENMHCRFDALSREYCYCIYNFKNPFISDTAWFYPYPLDFHNLQTAATIIKSGTNFSCFSKKNTQVKTSNCSIMESTWTKENGILIYRVKANRFLRGMVRALVATMVRVGRGKLSPEQLELIFKSNDNRNVDFSAPPHGLFLSRVNYPEHFFRSQ